MSSQYFVSCHCEILDFLIKTTRNKSIILSIEIVTSITYEKKAPCFYFLTIALILTIQKSFLLGCVSSAIEISISSKPT